MPWCVACDRFLSPSTVSSTGECPRCGAVVDPGRAHAPAPEADPDARAAVPSTAGDTTSATVGDDDHDGDTLPLPWHFKLLVGSIALYLGWRAFQGVEWVLRQL